MARGITIAYHVLKEQGKMLKECAILLTSSGISLEIKDHTEGQVTGVIEDDNVYTCNIKRVMNELEKINKELSGLLPEKDKKNVTR